MMLIGSRILDEPATGKRVVVSLEMPEQAPDGVWECRYSIGDEGAEPMVNKGHGEDALQALGLALEGIRVDLRASGRQLSWLGHEPGITGFHRVIFGFGLKLVEELEAHIDQRIDEYSTECAAGLHGPPAWARQS